MSMNPIRMINLPFISCIIFVLLITVSASYGFTLDKVLAVVDNDAITLSDYLLFAKSMGSGAHADVDEVLLKKLIEEKVMMHEATRRGIEVTDAETDIMIEEVRKESGVSHDDLEGELLKEGMNLKSYKKAIKERLVALKLIDAEVDSKVLVTEKEIEEFYSENWKDYVARPAQAEVKAIFLHLSEGATVTEITDLKRKALRIADRLRNSEDFDSLAEQYNDENLKNRQGKLGEFKRGALIAPLDAKAFSMRNGEISGPLWVKEGVYIVKLVNRTDDGLRPLGEVRGEIHKHLFTQMREKILNEWIRSLWEKAFITINQDQ